MGVWYIHYFFIYKLSDDLFFHLDLRERYKNFLLFYYMYEDNCFSEVN